MTRAGRSVPRLVESEAVLREVQGTAILEWIEYDLRKNLSIFLV